MNWLFNPIIDSIVEFIKAIAEGIAGMLGSDILIYDFVSWITSIYKWFAYVCILLGIVMGLTTYLMKREDGNISKALTSIFSGMIFGLIVIDASILIFNSGLILANMITKVFIQIGAETAADQVGKLDMVNIIPQAAFLTTGFVGVLFLICIAVLFVIIFVQTFIRIGTFMIVMATGVLSIFSLMLGNFEAVASYTKQVIGISLAQALQLILIYSALTLATKTMIAFSLVDYTFAIALLIASTRVDKYMREWSFTSGTKSTMSQVGRTGMQVFQMNRMAANLVPKGV